MQITLKLASSLVAVAFLIGLLLGHTRSSNVASPSDRRRSSREVTRERIVLRTRTDTVRVVVPVRARSYAVTGKATTVRSGGQTTARETTACQTTAFQTAAQTTAQLDTLVRLDSLATASDTLRVTHTLPDDVFRIRLGLAERRVPAIVPVTAQDSVVTRESVAFVSDRAPGERTWYEEAAIVILSVAGGYLFGRFGR